MSVIKVLKIGAKPIVYRMGRRDRVKKKQTTTTTKQKEKHLNFQWCGLVKVFRINERLIVFLTV